METPHTGPAEDDRDRERRYTNQDPAKPGGRGNALALGGWTFAFLLLLMLFFYALQGC
jgi:hypothetical protein